MSQSENMLGQAPATETVEGTVQFALKHLHEGTELVSLVINGCVYHQANHNEQCLDLYAVQPGQPVKLHVEGRMIVGISDFAVPQSQGTARGYGFHKQAS
jgi:hypothetical protein